MKRKYPGNRRTSVPADRHKRAVAYRHIRYAVSRKEDQLLSDEKQKKDSFFITADADNNEERKEPETNETLSIPKLEPLKEETVRKEPEKKKERPKKEHPKKTAAKKQPKESRKEVRRREKEEELEELLDEPDNSFRSVLVNPAACMDRVEKVDHATLSVGAVLFQMILKWLMIGVCIASFTAKFINQNPFGFAELGFNEISQLAAKLGAFGFVAELVNYLITGLICSTVRKPLDKRRLMSIDAYGIPCCVVLLILSWLLMEVNTLLGTALFAATCVLILFLKEYALTKADIPAGRHMLSVFICTLLFIVCGYLFVRATCGNIWTILEDIMNI